MQTSALLAISEKTAKFTPRPSKVVPSGNRVPDQISAEASVIIHLLEKRNRQDRKQLAQPECCGAIPGSRLDPPPGVNIPKPGFSQLRRQWQITVPKRFPQPLRLPGPRHH